VTLQQAKTVRQYSNEVTPNKMFIMENHILP